MTSLLKAKKPLGLKELYPTEYFNVNVRRKIFLFISVFSSLFMVDIVHFLSSGSEIQLVSYEIVPAEFILSHHIFV